MGSISLTSGISSSLYSLKNTTSLLEKTQERLASGKKINDVTDGAAAFFAARSLTDRASQLNSRLDSIGQAISAVSSATDAIDSIRSLVANMQAIIDDAKSETDATSRRSLGEQFNTVLEEMFEIAESASYGGVNLLSGNQTLTVQFGEGSNQSTLSIAGLDLQGQNGDGVSNVGVSTTTTRSSAASTGTLGSVSYQAQFASLSSYASTGSIGSVASRASQSSVAPIASSASQGSLGVIGSNSSQASAGSVGSVASQSSVASSASIAAAASAGTVGSTASQAGIASRASKASTGSTASISVAFTQKYAFTLQVSTTDASGTVGIRKHGSNNPSNHVIDFGGNSYFSQLTNLGAELDRLDTALENQSSRLSTNVNILTNREEFTSNLINTLNDGADKLTLADLNEEGANLLALQTRQSLAIQSLAIQSQANQQILRLLS